MVTKEKANMSKGGEAMKTIGSKYLKVDSGESICISLAYLEYITEQAIEDSIGLISQQVRERIREQQYYEKEEEQQ